MKTDASASTANAVPPPTSRRHPLLLALLAFGLGIVLTGFWFHQHRAGAGAGSLSAATQQLLSQLTAPVSIRYYSLLPASSADATLQAFAGRVTLLINAMQTASGGKLQFASIDMPAETNATAAAADGIQPFNLDKGDACFLGLVIASGKNQEAFARLQPEWEAALEYDLARAIARVAATPAAAKPAPEVAHPSPEIVATIHRLIPDVSTVSPEQANQLFFAEYLKRCGEVGTEIETETAAAQQKVISAQASGSAADVEAARKNLLQLQLTQGEKLKGLAAQLETEQAVFQQLKTAATNGGK